MSLKAKNLPSTKKSAPTLTPDNYPGRVVQVVDLGVQPQKPYKGEEKPPVHQIMVTYELGTEFLDDDDGNPDESKPRWLSETFPLYPLTSDKAKSTKRYLALDPKQEAEGDWEQMLGRGCLVMVEEYMNQYTEKMSNAVGAISGLPKGFSAPELVNDPKIFLLDSPDMEMYNNFPDWLKEKLTTNLEFRGSPLDQALNGDASSQEEEESYEKGDNYDNLPV